MATEAQVQTSIADAVRILEHLDRYVNTNAQNFDGHKNTLEASVGPNTFNFADSVFAGVQRFRSGLVSVATIGRDILTPLLREYGQVLDFPEDDVDIILRRLQRDFRDRGLSVILITHNVNHAYPLTDQYTIIRRGKKVGTYDREELSADDVSNLITGDREV